MIGAVFASGNLAQRVGSRIAKIFVAIATRNNKYILGFRFSLRVLRWTVEQWWLLKNSCQISTSTNSPLFGVFIASTASSIASWCCTRHLRPSLDSGWRCLHKGKKAYMSRVTMWYSCGHYIVCPLLIALGWNCEQYSSAGTNPNEILTAQ